MTTTQRPRPQRPPTSAPNPASRGVILVAVAVVVGVILLVKGGGVGFEPTSNELEIATGDDTSTEPADQVTTTTEAGPATSVPPASLKVTALNGAGINGYAALSQQFLGVAGYTQTTVGTAADQTPTTIVYFAPGFETDAATLAGLLGLDLAAVQPLPTEGSLAGDPAEVPADVNVLILLGPDVQATIEGAAANDVPEDSAPEDTEPGGTEPGGTAATETG